MFWIKDLFAIFFKKMGNILISNWIMLPFRCIFTVGKTTYVDFLPFYNAEGGSEMNLLKVIIHFKEYELLTHPVCELFLHLKFQRARYFYWFSNVLNALFTIVAIFYVLLSYGNIQVYFGLSCNEVISIIDPDICLPSHLCYSYKFIYPIATLSSINLALILMKFIQEPRLIFSLQHWRSSPEDYFHVISFTLIFIDQGCYDYKVHQLLGGMLAFLSCRTLMYTIARYPSIATFVEMVDHTKKSILLLLLRYLPYFIGWVITFHVLLGKFKGKYCRIIKIRSQH